MLDVNVAIHPAKDQELSFRFDIDEEELAGALNGAEARTLVVAILDKHGADAFADVAETIIDEFGEKEE